MQQMRIPRYRRSLRCMLGRHAATHALRLWQKGIPQVTLRLEWCKRCGAVIEASGGKEF